MPLFKPLLTCKTAVKMKVAVFWIHYILNLPFKELLTFFILKYISPPSFPSSCAVSNYVYLGEFMKLERLENVEDVGLQMRHSVCKWNATFPQY